MHRRRAGVVLAILATVAAGATAPPPAATGAPSARGGCTGLVALTFDDGPASGPTDRLVDILRRAGAPATFFMVGQRVAAAPALARRVERAGFLIGNHSWAHTDMTTQTAAQVSASLEATDAALRRAGTHPTHLMRPPYGALDATALQGIRAVHKVPVLWTVDPRDWESGSSSEIAHRILGALRPGANIVLQHDGVARSPISVEAVPLVIRGARQRGYCLTALDEAGRPGFPTPDASVSVTDGAEGDDALVTVTLSKEAGRPVSVRLRTRSGTARVGADLPRILTRVRVPAGRLSAQVPVRLWHDGTDEHIEHFRVKIAFPRGVRVADGEARGAIRDRDRAPVVNGQDVTVTEPVPTDSGVASTVVRVPFELARASGRLIRLTLATRSGSATSSDFTPLKTTVWLHPGATRVSVPVTVLGDAVEEDAETFTVEVVSKRNVRIGRPATVTIEPPPVAARPSRRAGEARTGIDLR